MHQQTHREMTERGAGIAKHLKVKLSILCSKEITYSLSHTRSVWKEDIYHIVLNLHFVTYEYTSYNAPKLVFFINPLIST